MVSSEEIRENNDSGVDGFWFLRIGILYYWVDQTVRSGLSINILWKNLNSPFDQTDTLSLDLL